jgi:BASS family bile acid:Na+ symporter
VGKLITYPVIFLSIAAGFFFPYGRHIKWLIPYCLALLVFIGFLKTDFSLSQLKRKEIPLYAVITFICMPFISYLLFKFHFSFDYQIGLFMVAIAPTGLAMSGLIELMPRGDKNSVIAVITVFTLLSAFYIPWLIFLFFKKSIYINPLSLALKLVILIVIPWLFAKAVKYFMTTTVLLKINRVSYIINFIILFSVIYIAVSSASSRILSSSSHVVYLFLAVFLLYFIQIFLAGVSGKFFNLSSVKTFISVNASKNTQLILIIALLNFGEKAGVPCVLAVLVNHITYSILVFIFYIRERYLKRY